MKDLIDYGVIGFLIVLSVIVFAIILERIYLLMKIDFTYYSSRDALELDLTKNLTLLSTIGTNAPYIGLLGTIGGIMITFIDIGNNNSINTQDIMVGLALALKATALGIIVAIPAIASYNLLLRKVEVILLKWDEYNG